MDDYFKKEKFDEEFFSSYIDELLPDKIFDFHLHVTRECDAAGVSQTAVDADWAMQCGYTMPFERYADYCRTLWVGREVEANIFPMPIKGIDLVSANKHIAELITKKSTEKIRAVSAAMAVSPEFDADECEKQLTECGFIGYKPYPDLVSGKKGADISIFDFIPERYLKALDRHRKVVILHLPRAGRLADPKNVSELLEMRQKFPDIKIVIAHYGRCYNIEFGVKAVEEFGSDIGGFYFDTAAVINPAVHKFMLEKISHDRILYGTDMPLLRWHGKRTWENGTYQNYARERFKWNETKHEAPEKEAKYTFLLYEQTKNMLDTLNAAGGKELIKKIFYSNAKKFIDTIKGEQL